MRNRVRHYRFITDLFLFESAFKKCTGLVINEDVLSEKKSLVGGYDLELEFSVFQFDKLCSKRTLLPRFYKMRSL
jgi:hypothetical protein